ncbi:MAG: sterol desaturase family protein [Acidimicrobiales bacterium]
MGTQMGDRGVEIASEIKTLPQAASWFARFSSPRVIATGFGLSALARLAVAFGAGSSSALGLRWWDLVAVCTVVALAPFFEWFIHLVILHSRPRALRSITVDPGAGHREHHRNPATINWVLLRGIDAALFQVINALVVVVVVVGPMALAGVPVGAEMVGPVLSGVVAAVAGLGHYEWSHFLFHTAYRPKSRYYRRLKSNHRLHHWRNERYWLGITSNLGDRVMRTYPASRSAVPLSPTVRSDEPG